MFDILTEFDIHTVHVWQLKQIWYEFYFWWIDNWDSQELIKTIYEKSKLGVQSDVCMSKWYKTPSIKIFSENIWVFLCQADIK